MEIIKVTDKSQIQTLRNEWENLLAKYWQEENLNDLYRSIDWIEHLVFQKMHQNVYLGIIKSDRNQIRGIIPFTLLDYKLKFDLKSYTLFTKSWHVVWILGSDLLLPPLDNFFDQFFNHVNKTFPDLQGIYFESIKVNGVLFDYLKKSRIIKDNYFVYLPEQIRDYYYIVLPDSFETYRTSFRSRTRKKLEKKIKLIEEHFGGIALKCYQTEDSIFSFFELAMKVVKKSWQFQVIGQRINISDTSIENKKDLARRNIFHSFILFGGEEPLAFSMGYKHDGTYLGEEIAYNKDYAGFSPGIVMIYLLIDNLIKDGIRRLNMGTGEGDHKQKFANRQIKDAAVIMLKRNLSSIFYISLHRSFMLVVSWMKKIYKSNEN